jgi:hypothetical protein
MENNNLQHAGIKGMKWGVRRYQNKDGSLTPAGRKRYGSRYDDDDLDEEEVKKRYEEGKQRALKSGSVEEVLKYKGDLTGKELGEVYTRLNNERLIEGLQPKAKDGVDKFSDVMNKIDTVRSGADKAVSAYNLIAKINNTFNKKQLPTIDGVNRALEASKKATDAAETAAKIKKAYDAAKSGDDARMDDAFEGLSAQEMGEVSRKVTADANTRGKFKSSAKKAKESRDEINKEVAEEISKKKEEASKKEAEKAKSERASFVLKQIYKAQAAKDRGDFDEMNEILNTLSYDEVDEFLKIRNQRDKF